jgi:C4-dicarboxylate-specific signal transduction histidine kinase
LQATETGRNHALRCRLAALERQAKRRGTIAREQLLHARRMMVIGRLIGCKGRIHHAMLRPLQRANERIAEAARSVEDVQEPSPVAALLRDAGLELDQAAALTRQLKLFSYRSAPQVSVLSLEEALRSAWDGLRLFGRPPDWSLSVTADANGAEVLGDAQRLGILLTILLIELAPQSAGPPGRVIWATVQHDSGSAAVTMKIGVSGDVEVAGEPSLGLALCAEIAQEMEGRLDCEDDGTWVRGYRLSLPFADSGHPPAP